MRRGGIGGSPLSGGAPSPGGGSRGRGAPLSSGGSVGPPPTFTITSVDHTAGTIDGAAGGGSDVFVQGTGFSSGMTSALGTVSNITATSCSISPSAHAAGALSYTLTKPGGSNALPAQTFTYLSHPTLTSLSPNHGPATLENDGVSFVGTNFPPAGALCDVGAHVGAGQLANDPTFVNSTHWTGDIQAPGEGSLSAYVTVDGVQSNTVSAAYTGDPPPQDLSATNVGTSGGSGTITGLHFVNGATGSVNINSTPTSLTIAFVSSTQLTYTLAAGTYADGTWDLTITNPDGQSDTQGIFTISTIQTPEVIFGAVLVADWDMDAATLSGSSITAVPDSSGMGNALSLGTSPTVNVGEYNGHNGAQFTQGSSTFLKKTAFALGVGHTLCVLMAAKVTADPGATAYLFNYSLTDFAAQFASASHKLACFYNGTIAQNAADVLNVATNLIVSNVGSGTTNNLAISENNGADTTATATATIPVTAGTFELGRRLTQYLTFSTPRVCVTSAKPTAQQQSDWVRFMNLTYKITPAPTFAAMTAVSTAGGTGRISGTGFLSGVVVTAAGIGDLAATFVSSTVLTFTCPAAAAGAYDIEIDNPDGNILTQSGALTVTATDDDEMVILGTKCIGLLNAGLGVTTVSGLVSAWADQSLLQPAAAQATAANRPTPNAADANYNGLPSISSTGSPINMTWAINPATAIGGHELYIIAMARLTTNPASRAHLVMVTNTGGGFSSALRFNSTGAPVADFGVVSLTATWGASTTNATHMLGAYGKTDGVNANLGIDVANGTEVTATTATASQFTWSAGTTYLFMRSNSSEYFIGSVARIVLCSSRPTPTELSRIAAMYTALYGGI